MAMNTSVVLYDPQETSAEAKAVAGFLAGYSGRTREAYTLDLRRFYRWCDEHSVELFAVTRTHIELYARELEGIGRAPARIDRRLSTLVAGPVPDDQVRGMALLCICRTLKGRFGLVEEVAVDADARGHHLGVEVMVRLVEVAHDERLHFVELTSRSSREAANGLYQSLGFEQRATNVYRHHLKDLPPRR